MYKSPNPNKYSIVEVFSDQESYPTEIQNDKLKQIINGVYILDPKLAHELRSKVDDDLKVARRDDPPADRLVWGKVLDGLAIDYVLFNRFDADIVDDNIYRVNNKLALLYFNEIKNN